MAAELRWILMGLSGLLLAGIWWWGTRRSRQAPGNPELRESKAAVPQAPQVPVAAPEHASRREAAWQEPVLDEPASEHPTPGSSRDWGVPPFEPLSIRTAAFESVQVMEMPMRAEPPAALTTAPMQSGGGREPGAPEHGLRSVPPDPVDGVWAEPKPASIGRAGAVAPPATNGPSVRPPPEAPAPAKSAQRIVSVRVCAEGEARWGGADLLAALESHGLDYGRYQVFHRRHSDGRTLFCAASLVEPGTFDIAHMPEEEFRGLTLFAVLPGPAEPLATADALIATAAALADTLQGEVRDSRGRLLSAPRAAALREDVARFQAAQTLS